MNNVNEILIAGFGGQGILFAGKLLAYFGLLGGKEVSWLPSYGPAMRGGTCNCSVCVSDEPIGSPLVTQPNLLLVMNTPSYNKFIGMVKPGGKVFLDSTLVDSVQEPKVFAPCGGMTFVDSNTSDSGANAVENIERFDIPATKLALDNELKGMANIIMLGKLLKETKIASVETAREAMEKVVSKGKEHLFELNMKALNLGINY